MSAEIIQAILDSQIIEKQTDTSFGSEWLNAQYLAKGTMVYGLTDRGKVEFGYVGSHYGIPEKATVIREDGSDFELYKNRIFNMYKVEITKDLIERLNFLEPDPTATKLKQPVFDAISGVLFQGENNAQIIRERLLRGNSQDQEILDMLMLLPDTVSTYPIGDANYYMHLALGIMAVDDGTGHASRVDTWVKDAYGSAAYDFLHNPVWSVNKMGNNLFLNR